MEKDKPRPKMSLKDYLAFQQEMIRSTSQPQPYQSKYKPKKPPAK